MRLIVLFCTFIVVLLCAISFHISVNTYEVTTNNKNDIKQDCKRYRTTPDNDFVVIDVIVCKKKDVTIVDGRTIL